MPSGEVILQATKTLSGKTLAAEQFSFELKDSTGKVLQTKKNTADGAVSFDEISYTQADVANSPITYTINEVIPDPKAAGYTYDSSVYSVSVALTDDGAGKITATPTYYKGTSTVESASFGNSYASSGKVILQATKTLSGRTLAAEQFSFELKDSTGTVLQTKKNTADGTVSFDEISYTQADVANSPITYTINEVIPDPKAAGYTYDSSVYSVSVALTDDGAGKITATPTYYKGTSTVESASFGNSYASSGKVSLQATKTLSGRTLAAEQFSFELKDSAGKVLQTKKNTADGTVSFDKISYTQADVANSPITYTINEVIPDPKAAGYTYDSSVYSVSVALTDDGTGKITATPTYYKGTSTVESASFGNSYASSGKVRLQATKTLSGRTLAAEQFSFELKDSTGKVLQTKKNTADGAVSFDEISYTQADVANSPITYTINEVIPDPKAAGYTYDSSVYSVSVALTDDGTGKITATPTYYKGTSTVESASFGNSYASSGKVILQATKTLSGKTLAAEQFSFELKDSTGKVLQTKKNTADGAVSFDEISYTQADVANSPITYTINEVIPDPKAAGYTYDSSVYSVSVALTDDGTGKITATPTYYKGTSTVESASFGNSYASSGKVRLQAAKTLSGRTLAAEQFSFELKDSTGKVLQTKKNTADGAVSFDEISYTQADVANSPITYTINEVIPDPKAAGYTYDSSVYSVSVALTDDGTGKITATPSYKKDGNAVSAVTFGNAYAGSGEVILQATKTLSGKTLAAEQFSFELKDSTGKVLQTKKNTAGGAVSFDKISYTQADVANSPITYTINEVIPDPKAAGYTYDSSVYSVSVALTDDGTGKITATPTYYKGTSTVESASFGNSYASSGKVILQAAKTLSGKTLAAEQFSFELKDSTGKVLQTKKNTADGAVSFDEISYTQADVANSPITYTINEVIPDPKAAGYTYDSSVYSVSVVLTDDGAGKITATPSYKKDGNAVSAVTFGNAYAGSGEVILQATKTLSGKTLAAEQFSFELKDSTGKVLQTKKNTAGGAVSFDKISYTQADVANSPITYTINEVIPDPKAAGYTYDNSVYSVSVALTDDGAGKITATPTYYKGTSTVESASFGNSYASSGKVRLQAAKTLSGRTLAAEQFSFELKDSTGKVLQTKKNTADGAVSFDEISYTQADVANSPITYTINEVIPDPKAAGYTYDSSVYSVSVALTDDGAGKITATPSYKKDGNAVSAVTFGNAYAGSGEVILQATKTLSGKTLAAEQFSFELKDSTGKVLQTKKNTAGGAVSFDKISYTQADVANSPITYTINEVIPDPKAAGYTYDSSVYSVSVALTDDGAGKITATPTYYKGTSTVESASFGNSYASSGKVILQAAKTLSGRTLAAEQFSFELKDSTGTVLQTKKNTADGTVSFDEISYTQADVANSPITYTINEVIPDPKAAGYTYDSSVYSVSVVLTDDGAGKITATPSYKKDGNAVSAVTFGNAYAGSGEVILQATKTLSGKTLAAEQFSFELKDSTGKVLQTKKNTAGGAVSFDKISYTQADVANSPITYTINEVIPDPKAAGYTYDSSVYSVSVALTDDGAGKITATPTYYKGTSTVESASFGNSYASSGKVILQAAKTLSGRTLAAEQFSFELKDSTGTVLQTKKNTADGTVSFDEISYTQADVANSPITYTINEVIPDPKAAGYTYDSSVYSVSVALTDDGTGKITATPTYYKGTSTVESASFGNSYASSGKVILQAAKTLSGKTLAAEQFSFELKDSTGKVLQTKKNTADGAVSFDEISYTQADVANSPITYTINEVIPDPKAAGYTYDSSVYSVSVVLTDDGAGKITATPSYKKDGKAVSAVIFENKYTKKYVYFSKVAAGQSTELKGASLAVTKGSDTIASWISGGDAKTLELDYNVEYTMVEKGAPAGYDIANSITFKINEKGEIEIKQSDGSYKTNENGSTVKMIDELTKYKVTVSKTDLNGAEVEGAKLVVKDSNGKTVDSWTSGSGKDNAHVVTVTMGTYTLHEDLQPAGYDLANDITFKVDEKGNITVNGKEVSDITMIDVLSTGNLVIYKTTNGATTPADTTFTITGPNGYSKTVKYSEFSNGQYKLTKLEPGDYKVTESTGSAAVSGYTLSVTGNNATATVTKNGEVPLGITNNYNKINTGSLSIVKTTTGAATPAGTTFTITGPNSFSKTVTYGDFTNGVYTITDLVPGDYTVTEDTGSAAVSGYTLTVTGNGGTATVAADANVSLGITNTYTNNKTGSLMIVKTSAGATTPAGTVFTITGPNGYSKTVTYSQFTGGRYTLTDLVPGTYTVTENRDSAVIASYALTVTGDGAAAAVTAGKTATVGIINTYTAGAGNLIVTKISNGTSTPTGTTFTITGPNGFSKTVTYGEFAGGSYMLSNLVPGNYTVTEDSGTAQVANYTLTVSGDGSTAAVTAGGTGTVTITNNYTTTTPKTGSVDLVKLDSENGALLAGAVFDLHRGDGSVYGTYTTDSNGHITVSGLPYGSYYFIETAAPSGYQIDETRIDFTISDGSGVRESVWLNFTNTKTGHVRGARRGYDRNGNVLGAKRGNAKGANRVATGDDSQMVLYGSISAAAAAALVGWILVNRKKKKKDQGEGSNN
jgi:pilin isopeptide linkage protein